MQHVRFIDPCAPRPYAGLDELHGLGGTEATLIRIVGGLADQVQVTVEQAARGVPDARGRVQFLPMALTQPIGDIIIVINSWKVAMICRKHNPQARICVWQHVVPGKHNRSMAPSLARAGIEVLCVSETHARMVDAFLGHSVRVRTLFNPIADDLFPDDTPRDRDLLFFASSPHKGLTHVAAAFAQLRATIPTLRLELADPGYLAWNTGAMPEGVTALGTLGHVEVIARMRRALCVFYPQTHFAETFGLVIAEANAVGCPALVQRGLGANDEVTSSGDQRIDATDPKEILQRIRQWRDAPPKILVLPQFRLSQVMRQWGRLLSAWDADLLAVTQRGAANLDGQPVSLADA